MLPLGRVRVMIGGLYLLIVTGILGISEDSNSVAIQEIIIHVFQFILYHTVQHFLGRQITKLWFALTIIVTGIRASLALRPKPPIHSGKRYGLRRVYGSLCVRDEDDDEDWVVEAGAIL